MAGGSETLDILAQIQALVSDRLQVVSYKWLSRNFSVSSNHAKRLLQEFVDKHGNDLEVAYTLSGWLKNNPQTYCIRLASGLNLAGVKEEFQDNFSIHVYSIQACIPKDLAVLWNAEFVQAEELFNQPSTAENCLRDNRFCGVSNPFVKRSVDAKSVNAAPSHLKNNIGVSLQSKYNSSSKDLSIQPPQHGQTGQSIAQNALQSSTVVTTGDRSERAAPEVREPTSKPHVVKEPTVAVQTNKRKGQNEKASSGSGGSLTSLWGRASAKPKPPNPTIDNTSAVPEVPITADAQICAHEAADAASSEDDDISYRKESNGSSSRKRRVVINFSDDEDDDGENVVNLASPGPPNGKHVPDSLCNTDKTILEKKNVFEEKKADKVEVKQEKVIERGSGLSPEGNTKGGNRNTGISLKERIQGDVLKGLSDENGDNDGKDRAKTSSTSPQRRKVLKTRIDERGREVTEVVWEGQPAESNTDKNVTTTDGGNRPPLVNKAQATGSSAPNNTVSKVGNKKPTKGGAKDAKQGNILSFFKKV